MTRALTKSLTIYILVGSILFFVQHTVSYYVNFTWDVEKNHEELRHRAQKMYPFFDKGGNDGNGDFQIAIRDTQPQINKQVRDVTIERRLKKPH